VKRNDKKQLIAEINIWLKNSKDSFDYSSVIFQPEYKTTTIKRKFWFDKVTTELVKYTDKEYESTDEYKEMVELYNTIIHDMEEA
jgi:hypothetical protein